MALGSENDTLILAKFASGGNLVFQTLTENPHIKRDPYGNDIVPSAVTPGTPSALRGSMTKRVRRDRGSS